ncbi:HTTM domain-containing protein [Mesorhizobium sp. VK25A]|uniref:HTTM domain-containing protein n=1 Tax=Mesorhizobium vachelliae TaxID=3072309 RepID=A0ABU5A9C8_9HYPH|nr:MULTISPECIES: HTTM domain-containing protein [unclassified Mesorhizobium]MDX8534316.1 HTTM domain-containing protein [Mesorhizobium sp. VK25D]MDX8546958.1 HTTM domain-containing protein [Mesorhizobium sp. VK25A]
MPAPSDAIADWPNWRSAQAWAARFVAWAVDTEGSSRSSALIRIGLAMLFWSRWAGELLLYMDQSPAGLLLAVNFFVATALLFVGYHSRFAAVWTGAVGLAMYYYFGFQLGREPWTHHHTYLLAVAALLIALTPCDRSYSLDRYLAVMRAERAGLAPPAERGNLWGLRLIVVQLSVLYFFAAFDKSNHAFLSGARIEQIFLWYYAGSDYPVGLAWPATIVSVAVVALEYCLAFGLPFRRSRRYLVLPGLAFHAIIYLTLPVYTFSATMALLYLAYFDADAVDKVIARLQGTGSTATARGGIS